MSRPEEWPWVNVVPWLQLNLGCARYVTCATVEWVCKAPAWSCTEWTCLSIASGRSTHSGGSWRQHISAVAAWYCQLKFAAKLQGCQCLEEPSSIFQQIVRQKQQQQITEKLFRMFAVDRVPLLVTSMNSGRFLACAEPWSPAEPGRLSADFNHSCWLSLQTALRPGFVSTRGDLLAATHYDLVAKACKSNMFIISSDIWGYVIIKGSWEAIFRVTDKQNRRTPHHISIHHEGWCEALHHTKIYQWRVVWDFTSHNNTSIKVDTLHHITKHLT